jgi:NADH-quinone oxidoreductase subunit J
VLATSVQWVLGCILILSSLGVILARKPVHASLSFLVTLMTLALLYLQLSAEFIAVMQVFVYAGAILVIFMFVIILFQDAHQQIHKFKAKSTPILLIIAGVGFLLSLGFLSAQLIQATPSKNSLPEGFGSVESLGKALYLEYFLPFEAIVLLFLVAAIGALYVGKKE